MRLLSMRLQNFRQHEDTSIVFEPGLTGIIGANGAGKTTILEGIAWALYGNSAARGTRDSIRFAGAKARSSVRVQLVFELAAHRYRVVRGLTSAECFLDDAEAPIASTISGVSELLQRRLGMTRSEFFHTYFTGQKDLDVMAALGPTERARFLSRVLGYDKLTSAQELVREQRRALVAEGAGLKQGMADAESVARQIAEAKVRREVALTRTQTARQSSIGIVNRAKTLTPQWTAAQAERERGQQLQSELRVSDANVAAITREVQRLTTQLAEIAAAQSDVAPLLEAIAPLPQLREALTLQDSLATAESRRQTLLERLRSVAEEEVRLNERGAQLETAPQLERDALVTIATLRAALLAAEQNLETERTGWVRDRQEAETRLESLRVQYAELEGQHTTMKGLGEETPCPTCGRPLGQSYHSVLDLLTDQLETVKVDGNYYRQRLEQLAKTPESVDLLEERRRAAQQEVAAQERRLVKIQNAVAELAGLHDQRTNATGRLAETRRLLGELPSGYDQVRHSELRGEVARLAELERRIARLSGLLDREQATGSEFDKTQLLLMTATQRVQALKQQLSEIRLDETAFAALRDAHEQLTAQSRAAELEIVAAEGEASRAAADVAASEQRRDELHRLSKRLDELETDKRLHDELDRAYSDLRTDLNTQLRPELAEIASGFLRSLTNGRYSALEFDEDYNVVVLENELPKVVVSGGEEDLCNLVLRLAISQMIAERAGQAFSLLILDEVFGSLDETRRDNVIELLRRLQDRFEQVIVITHIEQVREGLDRVLVVRYNEDSGAAIVTVGGPSTAGELEGGSASDDLLRVAS
ncbi:MAG: SMC family ATPase [Phycisphaerae bacterium]|nr:SMC family ATPase [Gemmatimonadaceae bacterium]